MANFHLNIMHLLVYFTQTLAFRYSKLSFYSPSFMSLHSSSDGNAPYEDFHEKYISFKHDSFRIRSVSFEEPKDENVKVNTEDMKEW